jgi:pyridoxine kinase
MAEPDAVLAIQSQVVYGHVGNSAAVLPLQRLGFDVFAVPTVHLAHHPGYGRWRGFRVRPDLVEEMLAGLEERSAFRRCAGVLSGYLGEAAIADLVLRAHRAVRSRRPDAVFLCDPVIGDDDVGVFVAAGIPETIRERLVPAADVITPNRFELSYLAGRPVETREEAVAAAREIRARGPRLVVATGLVFAERPEEIAVLAESAAGTWLVTTPRRPAVPHGTGDVFSALFLGHYLRSRDPRTALERATGAMFAVVERTIKAGAGELRLVAAQDEFAVPKHAFRAHLHALPVSS